jgi:choline dehydrogenase-like flavoprotein
LAADEHARVLLDYHATEIRVSEDQSRVERVRLQSRRGRSLDVSARVFILAAGGLENARLLLASQSLSGPGVGNCHGMVGRCYMSHLAGTLGRLELSQQEKPPFYRLAKDHSGAYWRRRFRLTDQAQRRGRTANIIGFPLRPPIDDPSHGDAVLSLLHLHERLWRRRDGEPASWRSLSRHLGNCVFAHPLAWSSAARQAWLRARQRRLPFVTPFDSRAQDSLFFQSEHAPNRESRVTLGDRRDEFGVPRLDARIRFSEIDYRTVSVFYQELDRGLRATRQGRVDYDPADLDRHLAELTSHFNSLAHQLGTTRMSARPQDGVVDADCRSHCLGNLYISGGSVFPTSGHANPTLTIVALALRLAEHVAGRLATPSVVVSHSLAPAPQVARATI